MTLGLSRPRNYGREVQASRLAIAMQRGRVAFKTGSRCGVKTLFLAGSDGKFTLPFDGVAELTNTRRGHWEARHVFNETASGLPGTLVPSRGTTTLPGRSCSFRQPHSTNGYSGNRVEIDCCNQETKVFEQAKLPVQMSTATSSIRIFPAKRREMTFAQCAVTLASMSPLLSLNMTPQTSCVTTITSARTRRLLAAGCRPRLTALNGNW